MDNNNNNGGSSQQQQTAGGQTGENNIWFGHDPNAAPSELNNAGAGNLSQEQQQVANETARPRPDDQQAVHQAAQQATPVQLTREDLAKLLEAQQQNTARVIQPLLQQQQQQQQQQPQMTQEEFNRMMNVVTVTPEIVAALGLQGEQSVGVLQNLLQAVARQAVTMAEYRMQGLQQQITQQYTPIQQYVQTQQEKAYQTEFLDRHKDLVGLEPLAEMAYGQLKADGSLRGLNKLQVFDAIADRARQIKGQLPIAAPAQQNNGQQNNGQQSAPRRMSTVSTGGQGGVGNSGGGAAPAKTTAKALWG